MTTRTWRDVGIDVPAGSTGEVRTTCPECSPQRRKRNEPCLAVNVDKGTWLCHHCGWSGGLADDAVRAHRPAPPRRPEWHREEAPSDPTTRVWDWIERERGIPAAVSARAGVEARKVWMPPAADQDRGAIEWAIAFPYRRDDAVINVKYRTTDKRFRMEKGAELCLYGLDSIAAPRLVWVEGEFDKLAVAAAGEWSCVSVPNGAPPADARGYERQLAYLEVDAARLEAIPVHVIATDADAPGMRLRAELIRRLGPERCALVDWPAGCKDANDVLRTHGAKALALLIDEARPVPIAGLMEVDEVGDELSRLYQNGLHGGEHPGSDRLAKHYTVKPGQWTIVSGVPGHGKSALIDWIMVNLAERADWRLAICSPENQPIERHVAHLAELRVRKPFGPGPRPRMTVEELQEAMTWLQRRFYFILPPDEEFTLDGVLRRARAAILRHGVRGLVIDPWNEIEHQRPAAMTETEYISQCLTRIRNFARRHDIHIWIVAHPTKLIKDKSGDDPVPSLYDVSGSAHWRNKADMGLIVWRDTTDFHLPTQVHIQKVRFKECGEVGMVELYYDRATGRYADHGPIDYRNEVPPRDPWEEE